MRNSCATYWACAIGFLSDLGKKVILWPFVDQISHRSQGLQGKGGCRSGKNWSPLSPPERLLQGFEKNSKLDASGFSFETAVKEVKKSE